MRTALPSISPLRALSAVGKLLRNPDDLPQVFTVIEALSAGSDQRLLARFEACESGVRLLANRPNLVATLSDRAALARMPEGSLAHAYLDFLTSENISAEGIVQASIDGRLATDAPPPPADLQFVRERMRDTHDLWHAVTGYKGDVLGEAALLGFILAQTKNPGVGLIVAAGLWKAGRDTASRRLILDGYERGRRAAYLPAVEWETLLSLPVDEVRARLGVGAPPVYTPIRSADLRAREAN